VTLQPPPFRSIRLQACTATGPFRFHPPDRDPRTGPISTAIPPSLCPANASATIRHTGCPATDPYGRQPTGPLPRARNISDQATAGGRNDTIQPAAAMRLAIRTDPIRRSVAIVCYATDLTARRTSVYVWTHVYVARSQVLHNLANVFENMLALKLQSPELRFKLHSAYDPLMVKLGHLHWVEIRQEERIIAALVDLGIVDQ